MRSSRGPGKASPASERPYYHCPNCQRRHRADDSPDGRTGIEEAFARLLDDAAPILTIDVSGDVRALIEEHADAWRTERNAAEARQGEIDAAMDGLIPHLTDKVLGRRLRVRAEALEGEHAALETSKAACEARLASVEAKAAAVADIAQALFGGKGLGTWWRKAPYAQRRVLQQAACPTGLTVSTDGKLRTPHGAMGSAIWPIFWGSGCRRTQKRSVVDLTGIEPVTS